MKQMVLGILSLLVANVLMAQKNVVIEPLPGWVTNVQAPETGSPGMEDSSAGTLWLLADEQYDVARQATFMHYARKILNAEALQDESKLSWTFDPSYQQLEIHYVLIRRGGRSINLLERQRIRVLQREANLEYNLYDGRLTAVLLLEDVQVGDVLDYAYSVIGENPIFHRRFMGSFELQWESPVQQVYYRMVAPRDRDINITYHGRTLSPVRRDRPDAIEVVWEEKNVSALHPDPRLPGWFYPYPWIQLSEFKTWQEVAAWAADLFSVSGQSPEILKKTIAGLQANRQTPEEYIAAALRFVQDDIRYFGMEMGENSHKPNPVSKVLTQRFGDCKDKAQLFCALMEGAHISAQPVLVNSDLRNEIAKWHPSPLVFDHVVVGLQLKGRSYYFDPTETDQRGSFPELCFPEHAQGLVARPASTGLVTIDDNCASSSRIESEEIFSIPDFTGPAELMTTTKYFGQSANEMRAYCAQTSPKELEESGRDYYAKEYLHVSTKVPLSVQNDDQTANVLTLFEQYTIDSIWQKSPETGQLKTSFYATLIRNEIDVPPSSKRTMPLGISHPVNMVYKISAELPKPWDVENSRNYVLDSAFSFASSVTTDRNHLDLTYQYKTLRDWVPPELVQSYAQHATEAKNNIGYTLYEYPGGAGNIAGIFYIVVGLGMILGFGLSVRAWQKTSPSRKGIVADTATDQSTEIVVRPDESLLMLPRHVGIRGWLALVGLGLLVSPVIIARDLLENFPGIFIQSRWNSLTTPGLPAYHPFYGIILIGELVINIGLIFLSVITLIYFLRKKKETPRLMIIWLLASSLLPLIDTLAVWLAGLTDSPFANLQAQGIRALGSVVIWIPYFLTSKRVKATFVE